jgi:GntR family transcriptional regulator, transcriptional repressor for pyruvate dehydrogenase complex
MIRTLEERIRGGVLGPGDRLPSETELEKEFGVSRTVVREGLQALKSRGMVESRRGSGTYVAMPSRELIGKSLSLYATLQRDGVRYLELMDLRILVETEAARLLADRGGTLASVEAQLRVMEKNLNHTERFADADIDFHLAIIKASGHSLFYVVAEGLLTATSLSFARSTHGLDPSQSARALLEHQEIFKALKKRDSTAAAKAMLWHLKNSRKNLLTRLNGKAKESAKKK